jgi:inorganic pyrophosphatase
MKIQVFVQNEAGSYLKNYHDEKALVFRASKMVSRPYPFPYGFVIGTTGADGCNVDCFVLTNRMLMTGDQVECVPLALMEQIEDGEADHNILAALAEEEVVVSTSLQSILAEFVNHVFDHVKGKKITVGRFLGKQDAEAYIVTCSDEK